MNTIKEVWFSNNRIYVKLSDGSTRNRPLEAFPTLKLAPDELRDKYEINKWGDGIRWKDIDEDVHVSSFYETKEPNCNNETAELLSRFPWIDLTALANEMRVHKSVLLSYIYGMVQPSDERKKLLKDTLHVMGTKLMAV